MADLFDEYSGAHGHFFLREMIFNMDLKRRLQPTHVMVEGFTVWRPLFFLCALFLSSVCLLVFSKNGVFSWTAHLQLILSAAFHSKNRTDFSPPMRPLSELG